MKLSMSIRPQISHCRPSTLLLRLLETADWALLSRVCAEVCADDGAHRPNGDGVAIPKLAHLQHFSDGQTQIRTGDTTIFSRVLYQLSYLAAGVDASAWRIASPRLRARRARFRDAPLAAPSELCRRERPYPASAPSRAWNSSTSAA
jgi:hypothetical protein